MNIHKKTYKKTNRSVLFAAAGTGGHIFPAMAVADAFIDKGWRVYWLTRKEGMEIDLIEQEKKPYTMHRVEVQGLRKKNMITKVQALWKALIASISVMRLLRKEKIDLIFAFGGYVSVPAGMAAFLSKKPLYLHEQNTVLGMSNRILMRWAKNLFLAYPIASLAEKSNIVQVGNPVRVEIERLPQKSYKRALMNVLVLGGSQGAEAINACMPEVARYFETQGKNIKIKHQTGNQSVSEVQTSTYQTLRFIKDMAGVYGWADLIICRAGALTVAEIAMVGVPALFVPYPNAVDDHQFENAQYLVRNGAAECLRQEQLSSDKIIDFIERLSTDHKRFEEMSIQAKTLSKVGVAEHIVAQVVLEFLE